MAALSNSSVLNNHSPLHLSPGSTFKSVEQYIGSAVPHNLSFRSFQIGKKQISTSRWGLNVRAGYRDSGSSGNSNTFVGGFLLGGIVFGTLGCVYAPQISKALLGAEKEVTKELAKFKYDEEKASEKT